LRGSDSADSDQCTVVGVVVRQVDVESGFGNEDPLDTFVVLVVLDILANFNVDTPRVGVDSPSPTTSRISIDACAAGPDERHARRGQTCCWRGPGVQRLTKRRKTLLNTFIDYDHRNHNVDTNKGRDEGQEAHSH